MVREKPAPFPYPAAIWPQRPGRFSAMSMSDLFQGMPRFTMPRSSARRSAPVLMTARAEAAAAVPPLRPRVEIPLCDPAPEQEARDVHRARGRFLARQDAWDDLGHEICRADRHRALTPGLTPVARLLAEGARADLVSAACGAVARGEPHVARTALASLEVNLDETPDCPALAYVVARAHLDVARAWRGASQPHQLAPQRREAYDRHMRSATDLVDMFDPFEFDSALWAGVRCDVLETDPRPSQRVADDYEDYIELCPMDPGALMALGRDLLPSRFGTWEVLESHARRISGLCYDVWGAGGYAWVYIGALEREVRALRRMDVELFVEGLHEILARHPTQHMANRLAAFAGMTIVRGDMPRQDADRLVDCFGWIVQDHMRELHPVIWAEAPLPGSALPAEIEEGDMVKRGKARAITTLAQYYAAPLEAGRRLVFTEDGLRIRKAE